LLPPLPGGRGLRQVAANVDRYLAAMPSEMLRDIHLMFALIEHGTTPLGLRLSRFTRLAPEEREAYLAGLAARGGRLAQAYRGLRDLCMLGYYQEEATWEALGYGGPWISRAPRPRSARYAALVAPSGALPRGTVR
jgi:D-cysteine desulfhydrase